MRKKIVAANWKMNMTQAESARFVQSLLLDLGDITDVEVVIVPPFTALAKVMDALGASQSIKVGAQNMHWEPSGAFTGEIRRDNGHWRRRFGHGRETSWPGRQNDFYFDRRRRVARTFGGEGITGRCCFIR